MVAGAYRANAASDACFTPAVVIGLEVASLVGLLRRWRSLRGNARVVVANAGGLSILGIAVREGPEVALLQELRASAEDIRAEAEKHGSDGPERSAAALFRPGTGQQLKLQLRRAFSSRTVVSLGGGCGCCCASVYGVSSSTAGQKDLLS